MAFLGVASVAGCEHRPGPERPPAQPTLKWVRGNPDSEAPILVVLHGLGDTPEGILRLAEALPFPHEAHAPQAPSAWGEGFAWFAPGAASQDPQTLCADVRAAADQIAEDLRRLDLSASGRRAVGLTGFSQGGMLAFELAFRHGDLFEVVAPLAGHIPAPCLPSAGSLRAPTLLAFHGEADPLLPVDNVQAGVASLAQQGWPVRLRTYPGLTHQVSPALLGDLARGLEHHLGPSPPKPSP